MTEENTMTGLFIARCRILSTALRTARAYIERDLTTATEQCCPVDKRGRPLLKKMDEAGKPMINEMRELLAEIDAALKEAGSR